MKKALAAVVTLLTLAACEPPMTAATLTTAEDIAASLGEPRQVIESGVYQIVSFEIDGEVTEATSAQSQETAPDLSEYFTVQYAPRFGTYATSLGTMAFYDFDGEHYVAAVEFPDIDGVMYLLAQDVEGGSALEFLAYSCGDIPQNYRLSQGIETEDCNVTTAASVLRAFGLMDAGAMDRVRFERHSALPDFGQ